MLCDNVQVKEPINDVSDYTVVEVFKFDLSQLF